MLQHSLTRGLARITTVALAMACLSGAAQAAGYTLTTLGYLPAEGGYSYASGINDTGQVVGNIQEGSNRMFLWDEVRGMQEFGDLPGATLSSSADGINNAGQVVGSSYTTAGRHAFVWDEVRGMRDLGDLPGGDDMSYAYAINNAGQVVGTSGASTGLRAFAWDAVSGMQELGGLPGIYDRSYAYAINNVGQVVGDYSTIEYTNFPFSTTTRHGIVIWDSPGVMQELGFFGDGSASINDNGQIAVSHGSSVFLWDPVSGMQDLGGVAGNVNIRSRKISNNGQIIGGFTTIDGEDRAFLRDVIGGMQDLNDLIDPGLGVVLTDAFSMNRRGQIVGYGVIDGYTQAFLLTPITAAVPVPAALPLMLGGLGVLAGVARRRSKRITPAAN